MEKIIHSFLLLHIAAGTFALLSGPMAIAFKHGGKVHRIAGKIFFYAMMTVAVSATVVGIAHKDYFLLIVAVFSAYLVSSGYRILYLKKLSKGQKPQVIDWVITAAMFAFSLLFISYGAYIALVFKNSFSIVLFTFGAISFGLVLKDKKIYTANNLEKNYWLYTHIIKMIAGNIAAFTAFLVVNIHFQPNFIVWILPSFIGGLVIRYYTTLYRKKLTKPEAKVEDLVQIEK